MHAEADGKLEQWAEYVIPCRFKLNIRKNKFSKVVKKVWKAYKRVAKRLRESKELMENKEIVRFCMFVNDLKR